MTPDPAAVPMTDIHDIKPLLEIAAAPVQWPMVVAVAAAVGLALAGCRLWRRRISRRARGLSAPLLPPEAEACQQLDALAVEAPTDPKYAYFRLSTIVRRYAGRRFGIPAAEMTTEELLPALDRLGLAGDLAQALAAFCRAADPIKYAGAPVGRERWPQHLAFARDFVRRTTDGPDGSGQGRHAPPAAAGPTRGD